jgi:hypothetical protein
VFAAAAAAATTSRTALDDIPSEFFCCVSLMVMRDPARTIDGMVYDRESIANYFRVSGCYRSPLTNLPLRSGKLTPADDIKTRICSFMEQHSITWSDIEAYEQGHAL